MRGIRRGIHLPENHFRMFFGQAGKLSKYPSVKRFVPKYSRTRHKQSEHWECKETRANSYPTMLRTPYPTFARTGNAMDVPMEKFGNSSGTPMS